MNIVANNLNSKLVEEIFIDFLEIPFEDMKLQFVIIVSKEKILDFSKAIKRRKMSISVSDILRKLIVLKNIKKIVICEPNLEKLFKSSTKFSNFLSERQIFFTCENFSKLEKIRVFFTNEIKEVLKKISKITQTSNIIIDFEDLQKKSESFFSKEFQVPVVLSSSISKEESNNKLIILEKKEQINLKLQETLNVIEQILNFNVFELGDRTEINALLRFYKFLSAQFVSLEETISEKLDKNKEEILNRLDLLDTSVNEIKFRLNESYGKKEKINKEKKKLRPTIPFKHFEIIFHQAGCSFKRNGAMRRSQLRIIYCLLFFLGLKLNEVLHLTKEDLEQLLKTGELDLVLSKNENPIKRILPEIGLEYLSLLKDDIHLVFNIYGLKYLGCLKPTQTKLPQKSNYVAFVNDDLESIANYTGIPVYTSHSFRITFITNLLTKEPVHTVAQIIGHKDYASTLLYNRFLANSYEIKTILNKSFESYMKRSS